MRTVQFSQLAIEEMQSFKSANAKLVFKILN